jgi:hypothetical protein
MNKVMCVACSNVIEYEGESTGLNACPKCGDKGIPFDPGDNVSVSINAHELRILTMWAERFVQTIKDEHVQGTMGKALKGIGKRLREQAPLKNVTLFLAEELEALRGVFGDIQTDIPDVVGATDDRLKKDEESQDENKK